MSHPATPLTETITLRLRPYPGMSPTWTHAQREVARRTLRDVITTNELVDPARFHDHNIDPYADVEDFWEDALRIATAYRAATLHGYDPVFTAEPSELVRATEHGRRLGPVANDEHVFGHHAPDQWLDHPLFLAHAGREIIPVTFTFDPEDTPAEAGAEAELDLADHLQELTAHRTTALRFVLKRTAAKTGMWFGEIEPGLTRREITDYLFNLLDWTAVNIEGRPGQLVLQPHVEMHYEMRHFVVDGHVVTSAGCIEEYTPINAVNSDGTINRASHLLRRRRRSDDPIMTCHREAGTMTRFAEKIAREHGGTLVIDTAINAATGQPLVVEFNDLPNSGLYACDIWRLSRALIAANDRGYAHTSTMKVTA